MSYNQGRPMQTKQRPLFVVFAAAFAVTLLGAASVPNLPVPPGAAVIINPGNGDYTGFRIVVEPSGRATAVDAAGRAVNDLQSDLADQFFTDLSSASKAQLPYAKSCDGAASGTLTTTVEVNAAISIVWKGRTWSNLRCDADTRATKLAEDASAIERALYVQAYRQRTIVVYLGNHGGYAPSSPQEQAGYNTQTGYSGQITGTGFTSPGLSLGSSVGYPYSGYPPGSRPGGTVPYASLPGGLPAANLPTSSPYSGLQTTGLPTSSPFGSSPYSGSPFCGL